MGRADTVREFNRFYTSLIGVLEEGLLGTPYSLTEGRVVFELAQRDATPTADLRRRLGLDAGYLSRILTRFESYGLVTRETAPDDARRQVVRLTDSGRAAYRMLDERSTAEIDKLLAPLTEDDQRRLLTAMGTIRALFEDSARRPELVLRPPGPGDLGWVVQRHGALYAAEYGWDQTMEGFIARIVADFAAHRGRAREAAWIAELDGEPVGSVFCVEKDAKTAQLRLLLVDPRARGYGAGTRLVEACLAFARAQGYERIVLWTNDVLDAARRIYQRAGFALVEEEPHHSFGHDLVGQYWAKDL